MIPAALLLAGLIIVTAPKPKSSFAPVQQAGTSTSIGTREIYAIVKQRCVTCHAATPEFPGLTVAPLGIELDSEEKLRQNARRVYSSAFLLGTMPLANLTEMTEAERGQIGTWFESPDKDKQEGQGERR